MKNRRPFQKTCVFLERWVCVSLLKVTAGTGYVMEYLYCETVLAGYYLMACWHIRSYYALIMVVQDNSKCNINTIKGKGAYSTEMDIVG
jgi:hypothetical protein